MIIACPECQGKLSSVAPRCPHCGFVQNAAAPSAPTKPASPAPAAEPPVAEFRPPSRESIQEASRKRWVEWQQDNFWSMAFGAMVVLGVLGVLALLIPYCIRLSRGH